MKFIAGIPCATALICLLSWTDNESANAFVAPSTTVAPSSSMSSSAFGPLARRHEGSQRRQPQKRQQEQSSTSASSLNAEAIKITMPALSSTMKEGRVVTWLKSEGDEIEAGEAIMVVESDKADMDVEAFEDGYLAKILTQEGETAEVGAVVALVAALQGDIASVAEGGGGGGGGDVASSPPPPPAAEASPVAASGGKFWGFFFGSHVRCT